MAQTPGLLEELTWRELVYQTTPELDSFLKEKRTAYCGFDPTASSLHIGHLVPVMGLAHLQRAGHTPIALVGGGTGLIGDPSGKNVERQLSSPDVVAANALAIKAQLERFLDFGGKSAALMRDNADWLRPLSAIQLLRDIGKHFSVNVMLAKESVQSRIEGGISFTEFSYMLLQAYDFLELYKRESAQLQIGGSDQWGNIIAGIDLIRKVERGTAHALTMPLVTTAAGTKFGKTEAGSVWLDPTLTSPYKFYQYWINVDDRDVGRYLRYFTLLPRKEVEGLDEVMKTAPQDRAAQQALATDVTSRVHGADAAKVAGEVSRVLFGKADPATLSTEVLAALGNEVEFSEVTELPSVVDALTTLKLTASKGAAKRLIEQGGVYVNGKRVGADATFDSIGPLAGDYYLLRKGAKDYALLRASR
ncbi:MAG: tyrosine--tRNA ligase [Gemmatimonadaceae bacterium]|nr:tyrosine--tRNA ligase [Gemmatimonadaceae bacterium]